MDVSYTNMQPLLDNRYGILKLTLKLTGSLRSKGTLAGNATPTPTPTER